MTKLTKKMGGRSLMDKFGLYGSPLQDSRCAVQKYATEYKGKQNITIITKIFIKVFMKS